MKEDSQDKQFCYNCLILSDRFVSQGFHMEAYSLLILIEPNKVKTRRQHRK